MTTTKGGMVGNHVCAIIWAQIGDARSSATPPPAANTQPDTCPGRAQRSYGGLPSRRPNVLSGGGSLDYAYYPSRRPSTTARTRP